MGWGDDLMISGEARRLHLQHGGKVKIISKAGGAPLVSPLWRGIDYIASPGEQASMTIIDSHLCRPYRERLTPYGSIWQKYKPYPAEIVFTDAELNFASQYGTDFVAIEPNNKSARDGAENRQWGWKQYLELIELMPHVRWLQVSVPGGEALPNVPILNTGSFRRACAVLANAMAYVGPEGGLHHASAAVGVPAVVIFGGYISPEATGYSCHTNLFSGEGLGCGKRNKCDCTCMRRISTQSVAAALDNALRNRANRRA